MFYENQGVAAVDTHPLVVEYFPTSIGPPPVLKEGHLGLVAQDHVQVAF